MNKIRPIRLWWGNRAARKGVAHREEVAQAPRSFPRKVGVSLGTVVLQPAKECSHRGSRWLAALQTHKEAQHDYV